MATELRVRVPPASFYESFDWPPLRCAVRAEVRLGGAWERLRLCDVAVKGTAASASVDLAQLGQAMREGSVARIRVVVRTDAAGEVGDDGEEWFAMAEAVLDGRPLPQAYADFGEEMIIDSVRGAGAGCPKSTRLTSPSAQYEAANGKENPISIAYVDFKPQKDLGNDALSEAREIQGKMGTISVKVRLWLHQEERMEAAGPDEQLSAVAELMHSKGIVPKGKGRDSPYASARFCDGTASKGTGDSEPQEPVNAEPGEPGPHAPAGPRMLRVDYGGTTRVLASFDIHYGRSAPQPRASVPMPEGTREEGGTVVVD
ncbi:hypothetical protein DFJ74DRAFT_692972 [Hyaloraphidium curvatum]|nr:hypothetical protein DFJ74DRAFT_692972 [Hyaloraphidium curvatum]